MAYFYVKSGFGTRTSGGGTTKQTGSMATLGAANVYDDIVDAITDGAGSGDFIYCSDLHNHNSSSVKTYSGPVSPTGTGIVIFPELNIVSVDDSNIDQYKFGAREAVSVTFTFTGNINFLGLVIDKDVAIEFGAAKTKIFMENCFVGMGTQSGGIILDDDGCYLHLKNCDLRWGAISTKGCFNISNGSVVIWEGGAVTTNNCEYLLRDQSFTLGGGSFRGYGVDLTSVDTSIVTNTFDEDTQSVSVELYGCAIASGVVPSDEEFSAIGQYVSMYNCSSASAEADQAIAYSDYLGDVDDQDDSGIYRDESVALPSGNKMSLKFVTNANVSIHRPLRVQIPSSYITLSSGTTDQIQAYLAVLTATTLTDTDAWIDVYASDGTNKHIYNSYTSRNADPIAAGTTLTDDSSSSTWKDGASDLTGYNEYRIKADTSGDAAADSVPIVYFNIAVPSITVYFDIVVEGVA